MGASTSYPVYEDISPKLFPKTEAKQFQLKDGRNIGYEIYGNPNGVNVILFIPGVPGSRFFCPPITEKLNSLNLKLVVLERPGYGISSPKPGMKLLDWPDDVAEVADLLGVKTFGLIGYSAGGPFALACLKKIPERISSAAIISSIVPRVPGISFSATMPSLFKFAWWAAANAKWILKQAIMSSSKNYLQNPVKQGREDWSHYRKVDSDTYCNNPSIEKLFLTSALEICTRQQSQTEIYDWKLFADNWGFELKEIQHSKVCVYHGKDDAGTTIQMGEFIHQSIANSKAKFVEGKGHLLLFDIWEEIVESLVDGSISKSDSESTQLKDDTPETQKQENDNTGNELKTEDKF